MVHQQCDASTTACAHGQRNNDSAAAWIYAQADASRATIASPFNTRKPTRKGEHFRSRQFHPAQK
jgi:hypothetical protein